MSLETGSRSAGYENRLRTWRVDFLEWCEKHEIPEKSGLSILLDEKLKGVTYEDLFSYNELPEYIYDSQMRLL